MNYKSANKFVRYLLLIVLLLLTMLISGCFYSGTQEKIKEEDISEETIINEVKNSMVTSNYAISFDDLFTTMFKTVKYDYFTYEEMKKLVPDPDDPALRASVEVLCKGHDGKDFVFAWNVDFDENHPKGFTVSRKCLFDCQTKTGYDPEQMKVHLQDLVAQKLVVDRFVNAGEFLGSFVPKIN